VEPHPAGKVVLLKWRDGGEGGRGRPWGGVDTASRHIATGEKESPPRVCWDSKYKSGSDKGEFFFVGPSDPHAPVGRRVFEEAAAAAGAAAEGAVGGEGGLLAIRAKDPDDSSPGPRAGCGATFPATTVRIAASGCSFG